VDLWRGDGTYLGKIISQQNSIETDDPMWLWSDPTGRPLSTEVAETESAAWEKNVWNKK